MMSHLYRDTAAPVETMATHCCWAAMSAVFPKAVWVGALCKESSGCVLCVDGQQLLPKGWCAAFLNPFKSSQSTKFAGSTTDGVTLPHKSLVLNSHKQPEPEPEPIHMCQNCSCKWLDNGVLWGQTIWKFERPKRVVALNKQLSLVVSLRWTDVCGRRTGADARKGRTRPA